MTLQRHVAVALLVPVVAVILLAWTAWLATPTDLKVRYLAPDVLIIESSTGSDAAFPLASTEASGLMSSSDVRLLRCVADALEAGVTSTCP